MARSSLPTVNSIASFRPGLSLVICLVLLAGVPLTGQELSPQEQQILEGMDEQLAARAVELLAQVQKWRESIDKAKAAATVAEGASGDPDELTALVLQVAQELKKVADSHPKLAEAIGYAERIETELKKAEQKWRAAQYDRQKYGNLSERQFRERAKKEAMAEASRRIRQTLGDEVFARIEQLRNPAEYARNFLDGEFRKWVSQPMSVGDGDMKVKVKPPPAGVSIFSPQAQLGVQVEYLPGQLTVNATGLYFRYKAGGLPEPAIDNLKVEADFKETSLNNIKTLGNQAIADLDLPVTVTLKSVPDFSKGADGMRGGIHFDMKMVMFEKVDILASDLILYPGNKVDWKDGKLQVDYQLAQPVPLSPTPFAMWTIGGSYAMQENRLEVKTQISTVASTPEVIALVASCAITFPVRAIEVKGELKIAQIGLAETVGKIDFAKGTLDGEFKTAAGIKSAIPGFSLGEGKLHMQREYMTVDARMEMFGMKIDETHGVFSFADGSGKLTSQGAIKLFGTDFSHNFEAELGARLSYLQLRSIGSVSVSGVDPFGTISCTVEIDGDTRRTDELIRVTVKTFRPELDVKFSVANLNECTLDLLRNKLQENASRAYLQFLKELAKADRELRKLAAEIDSKVRKYLDARLGGPWKSGNPELDRLGGELSNFSKQTGGNLSDMMQDGGKLISGAWHDAIKKPELKPPKWSPF